MWKPPNVERALFRWGKWTQSIVSQWYQYDSDLSEYTFGELRKRFKLERLDFNLHASIWLEIYWICCVESDYVINDHTTYQNIVVPSWLPSSYAPTLLKIKAGTRAYPPPFMDEEDIARQLKKLFGGHLPEQAAARLRSPSEDALMIFLPANHELREVLAGLRGRPRVRRRPGKPPSYSDRIAVMCAGMKSSGLTYGQVAARLDLPKDPDFSWQSETTRWLVRRGEELREAFKS